MKLHLVAWLLSGHLLAAMAQADTELLSYDFDQDDLASGPDTFHIFQHARGRVQLTRELVYSGERALRVTDVAGDEDFPELQGYFPQQSTGLLLLHFAMMTPTPAEPFNIALAGPAHFTMRQDGISFWLRNDNGLLRHTSDAIPKRLLRLEAYRWYIFEAVLDLDRGVYDLTIDDENGDRLLALTNQANATASSQSAVNMLSLIGDLADVGNGDVFFDDISIAASDARPPGPMVAPGRRQLFVDQWNAYRQDLIGKLQCLPPHDYLDFALEHAGAVLVEDFLSHSLAVIKGHLTEISPALAQQRYLQALLKWRIGCDALRAGDAAVANSAFDVAARALPDAPQVLMTQALARAAQDDYAGAVALLENGRGYGGEYLQWDAAEAMVAFHFEDDPTAEQASAAAAAVYAAGKRELRDLLEASRRADAMSQLAGASLWTEPLAAALLPEQYFFAQLWQENYTAAAEFAEGLVDLIRHHEGNPGAWLERQADARLFAGRTELAQGLYQQARNYAHGSSRIVSKLSDVAFLLGDPVAERKYREQVYGYLRELGR